MAEEVTPIPTEGPGSQTPSQVPTLHTPMGEGADSTGVSNIGKTPGQAGAPPKGGLPAIGGGGGLPAAGGLPGAAKKPVAPAIPPKTPEQLLDERSEKRLRQDIEDILITKESQHKLKSIKYSKTSIQDVELDDLITILVDEKGWRVDRLKELLPSRDEKEIMNYFNDLLQDSKKSDEQVSDVNQQSITPPTPQLGVGTKSSSVRRNDIMSKEEILVNNGKLESVSNITDSLNQLSYAVDSVTQARIALQEARVKKAGLESLGMGLGLGKDSEKDEFGLDSIGMPEVESKETSLVDALKTLTDVLKKFLDERGSGKLDADSAIKSDTMIGKAKDEIGKGKNLLAGPKKEEGKPGIEDKKPGMEEKPKAGEEVEKEEKEEDKEASSKEKSKQAMDPAAGGKKVNISGAQAGEPEKGKGEGGCPMNATMEAKAEVLEKIKQRMAKLAEARKANLYPFKQPKEYDFADINAAKAGEQASEIDSDNKSGEMTKDKKDKFLGQGRDKGGEQPKDPGMDVSKPANKAAEDTMISIKQARAKIAKEVDETVAKLKLAIEIASVQQLKGLISNPLKEAMIKNMEEAGMVKEAAEAIAHNSFLDGYQSAQEEVIAEAFGTLAKQGMEEFIKVASFTKKYSGELNSSVKEDAELKPQVKTASEKSSIALRGSQVTRDNDDKYSKFWKQVNAERISGR